MSVPVVLDVDTGIDDALALLLALRSPELDVQGVTCVAGNVTLDLVLRNTLGVLAAAGASRVPVAAGAAGPLARRLTTATFFHGADGIGGVPLPPPAAAPVPEPAAAFLCAQARRLAGRLTVVAVGPLTNVALACRLDPSFPQRVRRLVVMGGAATVPGNLTPVAEANFYNDPEAAAAVFDAGFDLTMVGLDVTMRALYLARRYEALAGAAEAWTDPVARLAFGALRWYVAADTAAGLDGSPLHDPLAVAAVARPELIGCRDLHVQIETEGRLSAGQSVATVAGVVERIESRGDHDDVVGLDRPQPNCRVALEVDSAAFVDLFEARLGLTAPASGGSPAGSAGGPPARPES